MQITKNRITSSINVAQPSSEGAMRRFIRDTKSDYVYLFNANPAIIQFALDMGKKVIVRIYDPFGDQARDPFFDNVFHTYHTAEETFDWFIRSEFAQFHHSDVYFIVGVNELSANGPADIAAGITWTIRWSRLMLAANFKVNMGGWNISKSMRMVGRADGSAAAPDVDNGIWDPLLKFAHDNYRNVIIDIHVYTLGRAWSQLVDGFPFDIEKVNNPPESLNWWQRLKGHFYPYWHFGREHPLYVRMLEQGWMKARFGYGECVWDAMADVNDVMQQMRQRFGRPQYTHDMRGILSLRNYYAYLAGFEGREHEYPDELFGEHAFQDMLWMDDVCPINVDYMAIFTMSENIFWIAYNIGHPEAHTLVENIVSQPGRVFEIDNGEEISMFDFPDLNSVHWEEGLLSVDVNSLNFRTEPLGTRIGSFARGVYSMTLHNDPINHGGFTWYAVQTNLGNGWIAGSNESGTEIFATWQREPDEGPDPIPGPPDVPEESDDRLKNLLIQVALLIITILTLVLGYFGIEFEAPDIELNPTPTQEINTEAP